tara:strand:+ start:121 stop:447 length:327 start_codon:yes stop_codon:yes gene_type:complete
MKLNKIIGAFGNIDKILEGVKNNIFKKEDVEQIAKLRYQTCITCEHFDNKGDSCAVNGTQPCCADCGCSLALKIRALSSSCPKKKWKAVMDSKTETEVKKQIGKNLYK